jgi:hypothetical protein
MRIGLIWRDGTLRTPSENIARLLGRAMRRITPQSMHPFIGSEKRRDVVRRLIEVAGAVEEGQPVEPHNVWRQVSDNNYSRPRCSLNCSDCSIRSVRQ